MNPKWHWSNKPEKEKLEKEMIILVNLLEKLKRNLEEN